MKVESNMAKNEFKPFELVLTIENPEDLFMLWNRMCMSEKYTLDSRLARVTDRYDPGYASITAMKIWDILEDKRRTGCTRSIVLSEGYDDC